ncbi:MAG: hypothetical protein WKF76_09515 [Nocardioidaceae bacterium]
MPRPSILTGDLDGDGGGAGRGPVTSVGPVSVDRVDCLSSCVRGPEVRAVAAEHVDPLPLGVLEGLGDQVSGVGVAAAGHGDVRRRGPGLFTDEDVRGSDGLALGTVHRGGVGEFHELRRVVGRDLSVPPVGVQEEAAVVADAGDGPGLAVRDLKVGIVAPGRYPIPEPDPLTARGGDRPTVCGAISCSVITDRSVQVRDLLTGIGDDQVTRGAGVGEGGGSFDLGGVDHDLASAVEGVERPLPGSSPLRIRRLSVA